MRIVYDKCFPGRGTLMVIERNNAFDDLYVDSIEWLRENINREDYYTQCLTHTVRTSLKLDSVGSGIVVQFRNDGDATLWKLRFYS